MPLLHRMHRWPFWSTPFMLWLAHVAPVLWMAAAVVWPLIALQDPRPRSVVLLLIVTAVGLLAASLAEWTHEVQLCSRCAGNTPLNTTRAARVVRAFLWLYHWQTIVGFVVPGLLILRNILPDMPIALDTALHVLGLGSLAISTQAMLIHRAHRPWCPYCDGGWDEDPGAPEGAGARIDTPPDKTTPVA